MDIEINYYTLDNDKNMGDGKVIPQNQELIFIKKDDDNLMLFETYNSDYKIFFWASEDEIEFLRTSMETWSDEKIKERNNHINGEFV